MPKGTDVHVPPDRENDPLGYPALRIARSRKVQKGEDKSFETLDGRWVPLRLASDGSGAVVVSGGGPTDANSTGPDPDPASVVHFSAFGLFDGHGGKACAEHCASTMLAFVVDALDKQGPVPVDQDIGDAFESRLPQALKDGFEACDHAFLALDIHSGATATVVVVQGRSVTTACVGDSLAIIDLGVSCGFAGPAQRLSPEHRLDTSGPERDRILAFGGEVRATAFEDGKPVGPLRVWPGGLAVSRTIGDRDGKKGGVISEPEVSRIVVADTQPGFRITLASDGLWDAASVKQAAQCSGKLAAAAAAAALCKLAQKQKDNKDDITVVVIDALADPTHKDPFIAKPPWKVETQIEWLLREPGKKKKKEPVEETLPEKTHSERRKFRADAGVREEAAILAARADAESRAVADALVRNASFTSFHGNNDASDDWGWEEVSTHGHGGSQASSRAEVTVEKSLDTKKGKKQEPKQKQVKNNEKGKASLGKGKTRCIEHKPAGQASVSAAAASMTNLTVSGGLSTKKTVPRPAILPVPVAPITDTPVPPTAVVSAPPTPAKKEKRKGKRERAVGRLAAEDGRGGLMTQDCLPIEGGAAAYAQALPTAAAHAVAAQVAQLQRQQREELQVSIEAQQRARFHDASPGSPAGAPQWTQGSQHFVPRYKDPQQFVPQFSDQAQQARFTPQYQHHAQQAAPNGFAPYSRPGSNATPQTQNHSPPQSVQGHPNPDANGDDSVSRTNTGNDTWNDDTAIPGNPGKQTRKGKRERAQDRARRMAEDEAAAA